ncbi:MAG: response regulator transcription factor [Lachnospiraceae bacterium]|nr:response regulator transcription factor [Lachnospiraceae bacterium]
MHTILIVEDDPLQLQILEETIHSQYSSWTICTATSYEEAIHLLELSIEKKNYFSLFLLDIQLSQEKGDRGGFIFANEVRNIPSYYMTPLLFLTAVSDENYFALSHYHCYNYIAKPYSRETILFQLRQMMLTGYIKEETLKLMDTDHIYHQVPIQTIQTIQSKSHVLTFQLTKGHILSREFTLDGITQKLGKPFLRCHKTATINTDYLTSFDRKTQNVIIAGTPIPVGRKYLPDIENIKPKGALF